MNAEKFQIVKDYQAELEKIYDATSVKIMLRIQELWPKVKEVQPKITGFGLCMGTWAFNGKGIGASTYENPDGEEVELKSIDIDVSIKDQYDCKNNPHFTMAVCDELYEVVLLLDFTIEDKGVDIYEFKNGYWEVGKKNPDYKKLKAAGLRIR